MAAAPQACVCFLINSCVCLSVFLPSCFVGSYIRSQFSLSVDLVLLLPFSVFLPLVFFSDVSGRFVTIFLQVFVEKGSLFSFSSGTESAFSIYLIPHVTFF